MQYICKSECFDSNSLPRILLDITGEIDFITFTVYCKTFQKFWAIYSVEHNKKSQSPSTSMPNRKFDNFPTFSDSQPKKPRALTQPTYITGSLSFPFVGRTGSNQSSQPVYSILLLLFPTQKILSIRQTHHALRNHGKSINLKIVKFSLLFTELHSPLQRQHSKLSPKLS